MATTTDLAPSKGKSNTTPRAAAPATREQELEEQIAHLRDDLKGVAATLADLSAGKVNEVRDTARSELIHLRRQGEHVAKDVHDQAGHMEKQLEDSIRQRPLMAVAGALGVGFLLALLSRS